jgi:hypothetical protein
MSEDDLELRQFEFEREKWREELEIRDREPKAEGDRKSNKITGGKKVGLA